MLAPLYMAEISPPEVRGSLMALEQFSIVLGVVFGFWMGFMTRDRVLFFITLSTGTITDGLISPRICIVENSARHPTLPGDHPCRGLPLSSAVSEATRAPWQA